MKINISYRYTTTVGKFSTIFSFHHIFIPVPCSPCIGALTSIPSINETPENCRHCQHSIYSFHTGPGEEYMQGYLGAEIITESF